LLGLERLRERFGINIKEQRLTGTDAIGYFRELLALDADWVINLDEDVFLLEPERLLALIGVMKEKGYAACGVPDGGVVSIRAHNLVACNAFFVCSGVLGRSGRRAGPTRFGSLIACE
jgi:hypothetical protein